MCGSEKITGLTRFRRDATILQHVGGEGLPCRGLRSWGNTVSPRGDDWMERIANQRLGERLRKLRVERKLTLSGVEALTEGYGERINKSYLFRVERGITTPSIPRLRILAKVFRVKLSSLLEVLDNSFEEHEKKASLGADLSKLSYDQLRKEGIQAEREGDFTKAAMYYRAAIASAEKHVDKRQRGVMIAKARHDLSVALRNLG